MSIKKLTAYLFMFGLFAMFSVSGVSAQDKMMKEKTSETDKPIVAIIKADWCGYCKAVDPIVSGLMKDYAEKLNFVVFDVTNEQTTAEAMKKAESLGLADFFNANKKKTSTVAVLVDKEVTYKTSNNRNRDDYVKAFDEAIE